MTQISVELFAFTNFWPKSRFSVFNTSSGLVPAGTVGFLNCLSELQMTKVAPLSLQKTCVDSSPFSSKGIDSVSCGAILSLRDP